MPGIRTWCTRTCSVRDAESILIGCCGIVIVSCGHQNMSHNTWCSIGIETSRLLLVRRVFTSLSQFEESISTSTVEQHNQQSLRRTYCHSKLLSTALRRKVQQTNTTTTNKCHASQNKIRSVNPIPCLFIMTLKGHRTCVRSRRISSSLIVTSCV